MTHTLGVRGPEAPVKKVFGLVWRLCRHTKPKTIESRRGAAPPIPVEGGKLSALPHQDIVIDFAMDGVPTRFVGTGFCLSVQTCFASGRPADAQKRVPT